MFRFTIRDVLWPTVLLVTIVVWWGHAWGLWIEKEFAEDEIRLCNQEIQRLRAELAPLRPEKVYPSGSFKTGDRPKR